MEKKLDSHLKAYEGKTQFDFDNEIMLNWYSQRIIELAKGASSILELGLGHGFTTNVFSKCLDNHLVLEGSPAVIENFKKRFPECKAKIIETYFETFDTEEKFDVIVIGFILEHVDDPPLIIQRFKKFLSDDGKIFISVPNAEALNRRLGNLAGLLPDMQKLSENDIALGHKRFYTVSSLIADIQKAGCKVEKMEGIYLKPFTSNQMASLSLSKSIFTALCQAGISYPELCCGILAEIKEVK